MSAERTRVLHVLGSMDLGGIETWLVHMLRNIDKTRWEFHFCLLSGRAGAYGLEVEALGGHVIPLKLWRNLWTFSRRFRQLLRNGRYRVVHAHPHHFCGYVVRLAAQEGVPVRIAHSHTTSDGRPSTVARGAYRWLMKRWVTRYATHCLAASHAAAEALFGPAWQSDPRVRIVRCGLDIENLEQPLGRAAVRRELGLPDGVPVIGHVGRFSPAKNHAGFVAIAEIILCSLPQARFVLVGDGSLRPETEELVRQRGLSDRFVFCGVRRDVARLLAAMDVFLFPSRWEGLGLVLVEAQAAGLPVVASDLPGIREAVANVPVNHLFSPDAYAEAASQVIERLGLPLASRRQRSSAIAEFLAPFDVKRSVHELQQIYEQ